MEKYNLSEAARIIDMPNIGRNKIYKILRETHVIDGHNKPYQKYIDAGYLATGSQLIDEYKTPVTLVVGQRGLDFIEKTIDNYLMINPIPKIYRRSKFKPVCI